MKRNLPSDVWKFIERRGDDECWSWIAGKDWGGYGKFAIHRHMYAAHRVVYFLTYPGEIELRAPKRRRENGHVLHRCDNPSCCNPQHLFIGTQRENMRDMVLKGRGYDRSGGHNPNAKLGVKDVEDMRWIASKGIAPSEIAKIFRMSWQQTKEILTGESWNA